MAKLTAKQNAFVREYVTDFNATKAAIRAGYAENSARQTASENLSKPHVAAAITELVTEARTNAVMTLSELQEWWSNAVRGEHPDAEYRDRQKASELLAKSQGGFTDKIEQTGEMTIRVIRE